MLYLWEKMKNWRILHIGFFVFVLILTVITAQKTQIFQQRAAFTFSGLHVAGNKLLNEEGQQVLLHGVNRSGAEYSCLQNNQPMDGPYDEASVQAMANWKMNAVRLPVNEHCWLGLPDVKSQYSGATYQKFVKDYIALFNKHGMYVILDMHWSGSGSTTSNALMANKEHSIDFWKSAADVFKDNNNVLFDLINEPHDISWSCWKDGTGCSYTGMQQLVDAVRSTGAKNVIMVGGLQYSNDLSQWLANRPADPTGNLAVSWHVYPIGNACNSLSCYDSTVAPVAATVPLIAGEVGESFDDTACSVSKSNEVLDWLDAHQASYFGWTWDTWGTGCGNLSLITSYDGTPHSPNGINVKNRYANFQTPLLTTPTVPPLTQTPIPTSIPSLSPTPTAAPSIPTPASFVTLTGQPTIGILLPSTEQPTEIPTDTLVPTISSGGLTTGNLSLHFESIDPKNNPAPKHSQRKIIMFFYTSNNFSLQPAGQITNYVSYVPTDPNGIFINQTITLPVPSGSYFILVKSEGSLLAVLNNAQPISLVTNQNGPPAPPRPR